jgi:hypothetical protein
LARGWVVDPDANVDREKRIAAARKIVDWLLASEEMIYHRVHALQESLCVVAGDELQISDCLEAQGRRHGDPLPKQLHNFLHEWATAAVPKRWESYCGTHTEGGPWLEPNDLGLFSRYLHDYLLTAAVFEELLGRLEPVVNLKTRDEAARRRARRQYVRIILNDYIMNPGPSMTPLRAEETGAAGQPDENFERFGLMASFVRRWIMRVPAALALGAGEHVKLPPGNSQLAKILEPFEK